MEHVTVYEPSSNDCYWFITFNIYLHVVVIILLFVTSFWILDMIWHPPHPQVIRFYSKDPTSIVVYLDDDNDKGSDSELETPIKHSTGVLHRRRLQKPRRRLRLFINRIYLKKKMHRNFINKILALWNGMEVLTKSSHCFVRVNMMSSSY